MEEAKAAEKERKKAEAAAKAKALEEQKKIPPSEMFKSETKYSKFDEKASLMYSSSNSKNFTSTITFSTHRAFPHIWKTAKRLPRHNRRSCKSNTRRRRRSIMST